MTVTVFGYLILLSKDHLPVTFSVFSLVLVSIEKIYQTVFNHISKQLEVSVSLLGFRKCDETRSIVFGDVIPVVHLRDNDEIY